MNFSINTLMSMTKKDLVSLIENLLQEKDELFHQKESLREELYEVETYEDEFHQLEEIKDILQKIKTEKERASLGIYLALETEIELTEKLLDYI